MAGLGQGHTRQQLGCGARTLIGETQVKRGIPVEHGLPAAYSRCLTPSCSPCSSARVLSMHSCEKASISRPSTILYSPFSVVTGNGEYDAGGDAVFAVGGHAHGDPFAAR